EPVLDGVVETLQSFEPARAPAIADQSRVWWPCQEREEGCAPIEHVRQQAAARIMHVVGVPIIRRAGRDDRLESGWLACRLHQRIEAAPRVAEHAHVAGAP